MNNLLYWALVSAAGVGLVIYFGLTVIMVIRSQFESGNRPCVFCSAIAVLLLLSGSCFAEQVAYVYGPMIQGQPREVVRQIYKSGTMGFPHLRNDRKAIRDWYTSGEPWISVWIRLSEEPPIPPPTERPVLPIFHPKEWQQARMIGTQK